MDNLGVSLKKTIHLLWDRIAYPLEAQQLGLTGWTWTLGNFWAPPSPSLGFPRQSPHVALCGLWGLPANWSSSLVHNLILSIIFTTFVCFKLLNNFFKESLPEEFLVLFRNWINDSNPSVGKMSLQKIVSMAPVFSEVCVCEVWHCAPFDALMLLSIC